MSYRAQRLGCALALLTTAAAARAQDAATAQALYEEGLAALAAGKAVEACHKLDASHRLVPTTVNLGALAQCHEQIGRIASAAGEFERLAGEYRQKGKTDKEREARARALALEPRVPRLAVRLSPEAKLVPGLEVARDDQRLDSALLESPLPVDPGSHTVTARAPGFTTWVIVVEVSTGEREQEVVVPGLQRPAVHASTDVGTRTSEALLPRSAAPRESVPSGDGGSSARGAARQRLGLAASGAGLFALGVGVFLGYRTFDKQAEARALCPRVRCDDRRAIELNESARATYPFALAATVVGAAALSAGTYLFFTLPTTKGVSVLPAAGPGTAGLALRGAF